MRKWAIIIGVTLVIGTSYASKKELSLEELKARAQNAKPDERANLCVQIAERQVENADKLYTGGQDEQAQAAIHDVVNYTEQASQSAAQTGHRLKNIEIAIRRMSHRLGDIKRSLPFESQATVQEAVERLDRIRTDLLNRMFGKNPK
jgi:hypothetical protein